jgi:hypothetical protein
MIAGDYRRLYRNQLRGFGNVWAQKQAAGCDLKLGVKIAKSGEEVSKEARNEK